MKYLLLLILLMPFRMASAQLIKKPYLGFSGYIDLPSARFSNQGYTPGKGMSFEYYSRSIAFQQSNKWGLRLGGSAYLARQNTASYEVILHEPAGSLAKQTLTNNHAGFDFQTILISEKGIIRPYAGVLVGCALF